MINRRVDPNHMERSTTYQICWADIPGANNDPRYGGCQTDATKAIGLCDKHYAEIILGQNEGGDYREILAIPQGSDVQRNFPESRTA